MNKKYKFIEKKYFSEYANTFWRIQALYDFGNVKAGDVGGWIASEKNLSEDGNAWVSGEAKVWGKARIYENAFVFEFAKIYGNAQIHGNASIFGNTNVSGSAKIYGNIEICEEVCIKDNAELFNKSMLISIKNVGDGFLTIIAYFCSDKKLRVIHGCFFGTLSEFKEMIKRKYKNAKNDYTWIIPLLEQRVRLVKKQLST